MGTTAEKINYAINATNGIAEGINNIGGNITQNTELADFRKELDNLYSELPKTSQEGTSITLANTRRGKMVIQPKGNTYQDELPSEYQAVEYIQSDGDQYIDTGVVPNFNTKVEFEFMGTASGTITSGFTYGSRTSSSSAIHTCIMFPSAKDWYPQFSTSSSSVRLTNMPDLVQNGSKYKIRNSKDGFYINNTLIKSYPNETELNGTYSMYIFGLNQAGELESRTAKCKLYNFKIYNNNILIREYIPCYRKSDDEIGLYEIKTNTFYTNEGTGTFTKGNDIPNPDYPQNIKVVTGENTIHIGNITKTLNLGNIELAKIGDYSDLIFKNEKSNPYYDNTLTENAWYKKRYIEKITLNGTENWRNSDVSGNVNTQRFRTITNNTHIANIGVCDSFIVKTENISIYDDVEMLQFSTSESNKYLGVQININRLTENTTDAFKSWLQNNNLTVYAVLITPTNQQITDTTLINQLEELNKVIGQGGTVVIETESEEENARLIVNVSALASFENS